MVKYGYDGFIEHKTELQELIDSAKELQQEFLKRGKLLLSEDIKYLERWLTGHIFAADMDLGSYLVEMT